MPEIIEYLRNYKVTRSDSGQIRQTMQPVWGFPNTTTEDLRTQYKEILECILKHTGSPKRQTYYDVGCYYGYFCFNLSSLGAKTIGVDMDEGKIHACKDLAKHHGLPKDNPFFIHGDAKECVFVVDHVILLNTFHHVLMQGEEKGWTMFDRLVEETENVFLMMRPSYPKYGFRLCDSQGEIGDAILAKSLAKEYERLGDWLGRTLYVFTS